MLDLMIADLHCDLLSYLASNPSRTAHDRVARCSLPQLKEGRVFLQTLAVYTETKKGSAHVAKEEFHAFENLFLQYPQEVRHLTKLEIPSLLDKVHFVVAIENASGLCEEKEPLEKAFSRLESYIEAAGPILYMSLTWNQENRFAGGNYSERGLKKDGEELLEIMAEKGIAIDLSHTSDQTAHDIINVIEKKGLPLVPIASHSNFRSICDHARNLTDEFAKEIIRRGGVIGLNFVRNFMGRSMEKGLIAQIDHAIKLGGMGHLCFGADFFSTEGEKRIHVSTEHLPFFHRGYENSSCYPKVIDHLEGHYGKEFIEKIAYKNLAAYFERVYDYSR
ncbi:MAG: membrane dipeptidase [Chlamydiia bacterium]|nr:membrane dipeptidase [Chlamydiia bacterium]